MSDKVSLSKDNNDTPGKYMKNHSYLHHLKELSSEEWKEYWKPYHRIKK